MIVYLAGPMSGYPEHNFPAFRAAAERLRAIGHEIISPVEMDEATGFDEKAAQAVAAGSPEWAEFLARDIVVVADDDTEAVVVLPGWERSKGARLEAHVARELGKPILSYPHLLPVPDPEALQSALEASVSPSEEVRVVDPRTGGAKGRKPQRFDLLPYGALARISEVYHFGAAVKKYGDHNWARGYAWSLSFGALMRHLALFWDGEDNDPESGLSHLAHAGFHVLALLTYQAECLGSDDRWRTPAASG